MKRKNISKDEVRADLADAKRLRFLRQPPRYGQYDGDLPVMLYLMKLDVVTPGSHVLGIKHIVPGTGIDSKPRVKWHYCSVAENGELVYKKEKIGYSPSTFVRLVLKKNVPTGFEDVFYDNKPLSYWLWYAKHIQDPEDKYYVPGELKKRQTLRQARTALANKVYIENYAKELIHEEGQRKDKADAKS